ncbi:EF-hand domain-containing protein [Megalodesulfovibrio gigas]|uniref:Putative EF hand repeat-containing protein n=1 Tax=Megalodesulfovibrio gigas (strain ATCC 19364 / DSM 1382 / NCIMB 9332 / VKM B-1759) TaxID=1121448 RepID=T2G7B0_MEGG1|nr:EF-hand domain-containing protein [Megalodesulfovibrio gigas]AGW12485.1 putative EF hand repeat-containing protein [Megalodesulfovibrio gigas DSM 1382 = ATCC 19364]
MTSAISSSYGTSSTSWSSILNEQARKRAAPSAEELFAATDADGDGSITKAELTSALESRAKTGGANGPDADELFSQLDTDGDGLVTEQEHADALEAMAQKLEQKANMTMIAMQQQATASAAELFASTDADSDGSITKEELLSALLDRNPNATEEEADELFAKLDGDGDGLVTEQEHTDALAGKGGQPAGAQGSGAASAEEEEEYEEADLNQDGVVTLEEMAEYLGATGTESAGDNTGLDELFAALGNAGNSGSQGTQGSTSGEEDSTGFSMAPELLKSLVTRYGASSQISVSSLSQMA